MSALLDRWLAGVAFEVAFTTQAVALRIGLRDLALSLILVLGIGAAGGFFPALRAARLRPAEALRRAA